MFLESVRDPMGDFLEALGLTEEAFQENLESIKEQIARGLSEVDLGEDAGGESVTVTLRSAKELIARWNAQASETTEMTRERLLARWERGTDNVVELNRRARVRTESDAKLAAWESEQYGY